MNPVLNGIALIVTALFLLWMAYSNIDKPAKSFWAILALGFVLRFFVALDPFLHDWDERFHALVAKNLMDDMLKPLLHKTLIFQYDIKDWTNNYIWLHKPPLTLWFMAISMHLFGVSELAVRLPSVIFSTLSLVLTYKIATSLYPENKTVGLTAMFLQCVNGFVIEISGGRVPTDHVDTLLLFWIELGVWILIRQNSMKRNYDKIFLLAVITSLAILTKWFVALLIPFLLFCFDYINKKSPFLTGLGKFFITGFFGTMIPFLWAAFLGYNYPVEFSWEQSMNTRHFYEVIEEHGGEWWYYLDKARINWNEGIYIVMIVFVYNTVTKRDNIGIFLLIWVALPYILFSAFATKMNGYVLIASPAIFIITGKFVVESWQTYKRHWQVLAALIVVLSLRYCIERVKPFHQSPDGTVQAKLINSIKSLTPDSSSSIVLNNPFYIETMFYTNIVSRRGVPSSSDITTAKQYFTHVSVISDGNNLPEWITGDTSIQIISTAR